MSGDVYSKFMTSGSHNLKYTTPPSPSRITYPKDIEAVGVLGPIFVPSLYARDLDNLEIGSSGSIALSVMDKYTLSITKNAANTTVLKSVDNSPIDIIPGDSAKTVSVGDLKVSSSTLPDGTTRINMGADAFRFGNMMDVSQKGNVISLTTGAMGTSMVGSHVGFTDASTNAPVMNLTRSANAASCRLFSGSQSDTSVIGSYVANSTTLANMTFIANNMFVQNKEDNTLFGLTQTGNASVLSAGSPGVNPMALHLTPTDDQTTVLLGNIKTTVATEAGKQQCVFDTAGIAPALNNGFVFRQNVCIDQNKALCVGNISGYGGNVFVDAGLVVNGALVIADKANSSIISWNDVDIRDKVLHLAKDSNGTLQASNSGLQVECGANVSVHPAFLWQANGQNNTTLMRSSADQESYWRINGGHLRLNAAGGVEYGLRINDKLELEMFKVKYDPASGNQIGGSIVVARWGSLAPPPKY